jgi:hypothetical protein
VAANVTLSCPGAAFDGDDYLVDGVLPVEAVACVDADACLPPFSHSCGGEINPHEMCLVSIPSSSSS